MRSVRLLVLAGIASTAVAAPAAFGAAGTGLSTDLIGTAVVSRSIASDGVNSNAGTVNLTGQCVYTRHAVGVGGSGITFTLAGVGNSGGVYKGIPIVATGVKCRFYRSNGFSVESGPEYLPGAVSVTNRSWDDSSALGGTVCVEVLGVLRQAPPGEDEFISSGQICSS
ncbi:MAG TPA: hypothetical protein VGX28_17000 [Frankiaceae bacterium]|jgi:hypothetical protein|nr:hypothetical protein [Frankiaceae bacterium]